MQCGSTGLALPEVFSSGAGPLAGAVMSGEPHPHVSAGQQSRGNRKSVRNFLGTNGVILWGVQQSHPEYDYRAKQFLTDLGSSSSAAQQRHVGVVLAFLCVFGLPITAPAQGNYQPLRKYLQAALAPRPGSHLHSMRGSTAPWGKERQPTGHVFKPFCREPVWEEILPWQRS